MSGPLDREPCPFRIVDDAGGAFAFGIELFFVLMSQLSFYPF